MSNIKRRKRNERTIKEINISNNRLRFTRTNLGFWSGGDTSYEFGIVFVIAGLVGLVLVLLKAKKLLLIPAVAAILGLLFFRGLLNLYGSLIEYTFWYYMLWIGSILLIVQAILKRDQKSKVALDNAEME